MASRTKKAVCEVMVVGASFWLTFPIGVRFIFMCPLIIGRVVIEDVLVEAFNMPMVRLVGFFRVLLLLDVILFHLS